MTPASDQMTSGLPALRLIALRAGYLLLVLGMGSQIWLSIFDPGQAWEHSRGIVVAMLGALSALCILGVRHPLRMLPLLLFEILWKAIWLARVAAPKWYAGAMDAQTAAAAIECSVVLLVVLAVPWDHVWLSYIVRRGERPRVPHEA